MIDPRSLCQIEIPIGDATRARAFYAEAFGWLPVPAELHEYIVLSVPRDCGFGIALVPSAKAPAARHGPVVYFAVDDPAAVVAKAEAVGGKLRFGPSKMLGYGEIWQLEDPDGNRFGLYRRASIPPSRSHS